MVAKAELLSLAESAGRADRVGRNSGVFFFEKVSTSRVSNNCSNPMSDGVFIHCRTLL